MAAERPREGLASLPPHGRLGRYTLLHRLGSGGMGEVWLAREDGPAGARPVAIKRMLSHLAYDTRASQMFLDEARIASQLDHPNVVRVFDVGCEDGVYYLVMDFVFGENLARIIERARRRKVPIPSVLAARIVAEAARGLHHAHTRAGADGRPLGIIHRDVTPPNIMVTDEGEVKVLDFGIAKAVDRVARTEAGSVKGKVEYLSPEQIEGAPLDHRADLFSLGAVLWELCTLKKLFGRETMVGTLNAVTECRIPPPSKLAPHVDPRLDEIVRRALMKRAADRYADAAEMGAALTGLVRGREARSGAADLAAFVGDLFRDELAKRREAVAASGSNPDQPVRRADSLEARDPLARAIDRALADQERGFASGSEEPTLVSPVKKSSAPPARPRGHSLPPPPPPPDLELHSDDDATPPPGIDGAPTPLPPAITAEATPPLVPISAAALAPPLTVEPEPDLGRVSWTPRSLPPPRARLGAPSMLVAGGLLSLTVAGAIVGGTLFYRAQTPPSRSPEIPPRSFDPTPVADPPTRAAASPDPPPAAPASPDAGPPAAPDPPAAIVASDPPATANKPRTATTARDRRPRKGRVAVTTTSGGKGVRVGVYLDGEWVGLSPAEVRALPGPHRIEIRHRGYREVTREIEIESGKAVPLEIALEALPKPEEPTSAPDAAPRPPAEPKEKEPLDLEAEVEVEVVGPE